MITKQPYERKIAHYKDDGIVKTVHQENYKSFSIYAIITSYGDLYVTCATGKHFWETIERFDNILTAREWIDNHIEGII